MSKPKGVSIKIFRVIIVIVLLGMNFISFSSLKAENKPLIKVILLDEEVGKIPNYIAEKEKEGFIVEEEKVSNVGNTPEEMKIYIRKEKIKNPNLQYVIIPIDFLSYMLKARTGCPFNRETYLLAVSDFYYCNLDDDDMYIPDIYISRANAAMLNIKRKHLPNKKMTVAFPITTYKSFAYVDRNTPVFFLRIDPSRLGQYLKDFAQNHNIITTTLFETEGVKPSFVKPDEGLNADSFIKHFIQSNYINCEWSHEVIRYKENINGQNFVLLNDATNFYRTVWENDANGNDLAEEDEREQFLITDFDVLPDLIGESNCYIDRIGYSTLNEFEYSENVNNLSKLYSGLICRISKKVYCKTLDYYSNTYPEAEIWPHNINDCRDECFFGKQNWYIRNYDFPGDGCWLPGEDKPRPWQNYDITNYYSYSFFSANRLMNEYLISDFTISEAKWWNINQSIKLYQSMEHLYDSETHSLWDFTVYGDPTKKISTLVGKPQIEFKPNELNNNGVLHVPTNKSETTFSIINTGESNLEITIEYNEKLLKIQPKEVIIEPTKENAFLIRLNEGTYRSNRTPKSKQTTITIKSNAGDKKILVKWKGI